MFLVLSLVTLGFYWVKRKFDFWYSLGFPACKPKFPTGNMAGVGTKITIGEMMRNCYNELKGQGPIGGAFFYTEPAAVVVDMDLLRNIFVKDFQYFHDRGLYVNERDDPLSAHLFSLEGAQWKNLRNKLSPTFTSGKMKMMHSTMLSVADQFRDNLREVCDHSAKEFELKEILAQLTTDIIGNVAFGIECNTMKDANSEFRRIGKKIFENDATKLIKDIFTSIFPNLSRRLKVKTIHPEVTAFFTKLLADTVKYREENNVQRNDFLSLLIQIMNTGKLDGESDDLGKMTFNELAAQVFLFFIAGFETSSSTMTFTFYELALNKEIQDRAREEIREVIERHGGKLTYEAAMELKYIDQIIQETLRKYPVADTLLRQSGADYKIPDTNLILPKGTQVLIPILGFHRDPEIYPDPDKFDPERFNKENIAARHPYAWIPFGEGPRNCVGMRFGMMQTRMGIATIINNFIVTPSEKTIIPMQFQPDAQVMSPLGGMFLNLEPCSDL